MAPLVVTAAIIRRNNKVLLAQRDKNSKHPLKWEFPGGKLEEGESPEMCLKREIREELNLDIDVKDIFKVVYHEYPERAILLLCYLCDPSDGEVLPLECNDFRWIDVEQIHKFSIVEADITVVEKIEELGAKIFKV